MSIAFGLIALLVFLIAVLATGVAVLKPEFRTAAIVVAALGYVSSGAIVALFLLLVSRMS